ncbi:MAG: hypothetical protein JW733_00980 [Coriobacteriia bacterium]|nr:hypothetical protein [Coriobacteriia bacterium]MBN2848531.1 hypothetical protein [Coriobacteriia bacterium]
MSDRTPKETDFARPVDRWALAEAVPDTIISLPTPRTHEEERVRREFRGRVRAAGATLGFESGPEGVWRSSTGVTISTRLSERPVTPAAAVHFVTQIVRAAQEGSAPRAVLFVVAHPEAAVSFTVAIRHCDVYDLVRTITVDDLELLAVLVGEGRVTHEDAVSVLAPVAGIDAGALVNAVARACVRGSE